MAATNSLTEEDLPAIPEGFELLYVTGLDSPAWVDAFLIAGEMLYWAQRGQIWRAAKDGSGEPIVFGDYATTNQGSRMFDRGGYIYWHDGPHIKRKRKDSQALTKSQPDLPFNFPSDETYREDTESIEYGGDYPLGRWGMDETHIYIAPNACSPIHKVDLQTLQVETFEFDRPDYTGGGGSFALDDTFLYCANNDWLFRIGKNGQDPQVLADGFVELWDIRLSGGLLYLADQPPGVSAADLYTSTVEGAVRSLGKASAPGSANSFGSPLVVDETRSTLYVFGAGAGVTLARLDLESGRFASVFRANLNYAFNADEDYLYMASKLVPDNYVVVIMRIHKDRLEQLIEENSTDE